MELCTSHTPQTWLDSPIAFPTKRLTWLACFPIMKPMGNISSMNLFFLSLSKVIPCPVSWEWPGGSKTTNHISAGTQEGTARVPLSSGQGERVIRLNPLFGSVSFTSRLGSEQSILQPLIHQPGALSCDGRAGPSAGARMDGCHSSLWGVKGVVSYSDCGTSPPNTGARARCWGRQGELNRLFWETCQQPWEHSVWATPK